MIGVRKFILLMIDMRNSFELLDNAWSVIFQDEQDNEQSDAFKCC
jgi:hypothetical protein